MGLLLVVFVCEAGPHDSQKAPHALQKLLGKVPRLKTVFADKGYEATPDGLIWRCFGWLLEVVRRDEDASGFDPIPNLYEGSPKQGPGAPKKYAAMQRRSWGPSVSTGGSNLAGCTGAWT